MPPVSAAHAASVHGLTQRAQAMASASVDSYNARIKDRILLAYAREELEELGIAKFLRF